MEFGLVAILLVLFLLLGVLASPVATWLIGHRNGAALSFPLALVVITVVGHLIGHLAMGLPAVLVGVAALVGLSAVAWRSVPVDWRTYTEAATVFVLGFLLVVLIRAFTPSAAPLPIAIGEKFLDFGLLATLDRADTLPPEDMWFAGEHIVYHYGGHLTTELVATLAGTEPRYAYNLGLAAFFGALVAAAYGLAGAIADGYDVSTRFAGVLGAFFVGIAGNLHTVAQVAGWLLPDGFERWFLGLIGADPSYAGWSPSEFWYFEASRVLPGNPALEDPWMAATEFPLFAWINGDLHAHMMSQPSVLLGAAVLFGYWRSTDRHRYRQLVLFGAMPVVAGVVGITNVWSFPTVGGLVFLTVWFAPGDPARSFPGLAPRLGPRSGTAVEEVRRIVLGVVATVAVLALAVVWTFPFWFGVVVEGPSRSLAFWAPWTPLGSFLIHLGGFLLVLVPFLASRVWVGTDRAPALLLGAGLFAVAGIVLGAPAVGLFVPMLLGGWWLLRTRRDVGFETVLLVGALGLVLLVETLTMEGERFNVVFKPYVEIWLFLAIAASVALARMASGWPSSETVVQRNRWRQVGRGLLAFVVVTTGLYGAFAVPIHLDTGSSVTAETGPTLDAKAFVDVEYPDEAPAIRWIGNLSGQPNIVTAVPANYYWYPDRGQGASAPASLTGVPTVLGWYHERQYRGSEAYDRRFEATRTIYQGTDPSEQTAQLREYNVQYVYVGQAERERYEEITIDEVAGVTVAAQWPEVTIYRVEQDALPE